jgi:hypothetical protein
MMQLTDSAYFSEVDINESIKDLQSSNFVLIKKFKFSQEYDTEIPENFSSHSPLWIGERY